MHQRLKFQGHACGRWSPLLRPSRLHSVEHKQQWQGHVKTLMVCSTLLHWQSTSQRWRAYLALHCQVILMTPFLIHKHKTPPILFVRVFIPVTSEQRETVNVYMRVADSISQPCFCVTHRTTRAVFMFGIWHMRTAHRACLPKIVCFPLWSTGGRACAFSPCSSVWLHPVFLGFISFSMSKSTGCVTVCDRSWNSCAIV